MEKSVHKFKYQRHSEKQYMTILTAAERLFVEEGIDKVSLADIAEKSGIMRSTFYRYFKNKDEILWHIMRRHTTNFSRKLDERFRLTGRSAIARYKTFFNVLYETFVTDSTSFLFIDLFNDTYQYATSGNDTGLYNEVFTEQDFRSGDTVRFLMEDFDDGSVKSGLDPKDTAVSITYSAFSIVAGMSKQTKTLYTKYGVCPENVVRTGFNALLDSIKA